MAKLGTQFSENLLAEVNASAVVVDDKAELDGLTDEQITSAAAKAKERGLDGKYVITLLNTTGQPPLSQLTNRALRERIHKASVGRNSRGHEYDNTDRKSEEHTSELQSLMRISYAVFCLKKKNQTHKN